MDAISQEVLMNWIRNTSNMWSEITPSQLLPHLTHDDVIKWKSNARHCNGGHISYQLSLSTPILSTCYAILRVINKIIRQVVILIYIYMIYMCVCVCLCVCVCVCVCVRVRVCVCVLRSLFYNIIDYGWIIEWFYIRAHFFYKIQSNASRALEMYTETEILSFRWNSHRLSGIGYTEGCQMTTFSAANDATFVKITYFYQGSTLLQACIYMACTTKVSHTKFKTRIMLHIAAVST